MTPQDAYRLSRIQAEGWKAAHAIPSNDSANLDEARLEGLCPYPADPERAQWLTGFRNALKA